MLGAPLDEGKHPPIDPACLSRPIWDISRKWVDTHPSRDDHEVVANGGAGQLVAEVQRLGARALPYAELHSEITDRLRTVMKIDAACWHGLDPDNVLLTTANPVELFANGFMTAD